MGETELTPPQHLFVDYHLLRSLLVQYERPRMRVPSVPQSKAVDNLGLLPIGVRKGRRSKVLKSTRR